MGYTMLVPTLLCALVASSVATTPLMELKADFEFFDERTNVDEPRYRLKDTIQPTYQYVDLDVYVDEARFNGYVEIRVQIRENLTQIVLHQKVVSISGVNVLDSNGSPLPLQFPNPFTTDDYFELLYINLAATIPSGNYTITVRYTGQINTNPVDRGFYQGYYYVNNQKRLYATTQFQPFHARKAFPCFDEPQFKNVYVISITRASTLSNSYSNMAINTTEVVATGRVRETFFPTPIISAYLVAFHVSDFVETGLTSAPGKPFGIISRQGVTDQHEYAADIGLKITDELDDYFAIQYHQMGQGTLMKNDHIALPDFPSGAMENWGMVNYREAYLLYDANNTNILNKIFIATIMAHELAHKWFGNLVTCFWWSNLWLNESYASFFEYFGAHYADPSLELDEQFVVDYVHSALNADSGASATPMNWTGVVDNPSVSAHFSTTSYAKGASVLRMLEHFVGARTFRNALRYYLNDNAYDIGTPEDMYAGFAKAVNEDFNFLRDFPNVNIGAVFDSWVQNPGSPVVNVDVNLVSGVATITQERFLISGASPPDNLWQIPITWTHSISPNFNDTKPSFVLTTRTSTIALPARDSDNFWIMLNNARSGLYRVNYNDYNWQMIAAYLRNSRTNVHKLSRAAIVNDVLHFLRAGKISTVRAFDVLSFLSQETDYYVWVSALGQLDWLHRRFEHLDDAHTLYRRYLVNSIQAVVQNLGYEERATDSTSTILNRMQIMNIACNNGHDGCISDSLNKWTQYRNNDTNLVPVNLRRYVYCTGIREGNATDYQFLFQKYNTSENTADMVVILRTLACTKDAASLRHYLDQTMYNDRIRIHDKTNAFQYALQGNRENLPIVLEFLYQNFQTINTTYGGDARLNICISALATYLTDFDTIREFQTWAYANQIALGSSFNTAVAAVNSAMNNLEWGSNNVAEVYDVLLTSSSSTVVSSVVLLAVALFTQLFR